MRVLKKIKRLSAEIRGLPSEDMQTDGSVEDREQQMIVHSCRGVYVPTWKAEP